MKMEIPLFHFVSDDIRISIDAKFVGDSLIIDGYDIGKRVDEYWGDSDYEYTTTINAENADMLFRLFNIPSGDKMGLLKELARRYHTNKCYSEIQKLLDDNKIPYESFSWT